MGATSNKQAIRCHDGVKRVNTTESRASSVLENTKRLKRICYTTAPIGVEQVYTQRAMLIPWEYR